MLLYRLLQVVASPLIFLYFLLRFLTVREFRSHFQERLGLLRPTLPSPHPDGIWIHGVSVGEIASAVPLIKSLRQQAPHLPIYLSTGTVAGRRMAEKRVAGQADGIFYAPIDYVFAVRRVLKWLRPSLLIILETEIWPNLYHETVAAGSGLLLLNARISNRTWPRYLRFRWFFRPLLRLPQQIVTQSDTDLARFRRLGALERQLSPPANLKYDAAISFARPALNLGAAGPVWIAASTVGPEEGGSARHQITEEELVIDVYRSLVADHPKLLLILAPRQPARFARVERLLANSGLPFRRRTQAEPPPVPGVLLLDTVGELAGLFSLATVVFVGGSIAPRGGHNILEPAAAGKPIVVGPHMDNFQSIADDFRAASAIRQLRPDENLRSAIAELLAHPGEAIAMGERARSLLASRAGVARRLADDAIGIASLHHCQTVRALPARLALSGLARVWAYGGRIKRQRAIRFAAQRPSLGRPVISVGGITLGGSGKTPFTSYLAELLHQAGYRPAILTRGYRRRLPAKEVIALPDAVVPTAFTGDEAQLYLRTGFAAVGISADRYEAGRDLLKHYPDVDIFLLDDGFQHARLPRDLDIVLIDGLDPFGDQSIVPAGRLREPLESLSRAHLFVLTRCQSPAQFRAVRNTLALYNSRAPLLEAPLRVRGWRDVFTGSPLHIAPGSRVMAFCGLGNPRNFLATLQSLKLEVVAHQNFPDHHFYKPSELRSLQYAAERHGAELLVTTEKDMVNLPEQASSALSQITVACLAIDLYVTDEPALVNLLEKLLPGISAGRRI